MRDIEPLGHGGHGWVSKVQCNRSHQVLARKTVRWRFSSSALRQIQEEVRIMRSLSHSHIARVRGSYIQSSTSYSILIEPVADCDLSTFLNIYSEEVQGGRNSTLLSATSLALSTITFSRAEEILLCSFGCLSSALAYIHSQRMKHKDVKPTNILVHNGSVLFTDFGLATDFSETANSISSGPTACTRIVRHSNISHPSVTDILSGRPRKSQIPKESKEAELQMYSLLAVFSPRSSQYSHKSHLWNSTHSEKTEVVSAFGTALTILIPGLTA